ncbi:MAG: tripartite tricarboxylate transporter substrate-binding protein [Gammaproteobacteria bacterium]
MLPMKLLKPLAVAAAVALPGTAFAESVEEFYSGNTLNLYIGYSVGGGYDTYARLIASHMGKHIPGNPTIVPTNMPGAGSLRLSNWLYEAAPRDGSAIGTIARAAPFEPLLENEAAKFTASEFNFIGNANSEYSLCAARVDAGIENIEDLRSEELLVGGTGAASDPTKQAKVANVALGTKMQVIDGYPGGNDITLAMERGETMGRCGWSWSTIKATKWDLIENGEVKLLLQFATKQHPDLTDVPLVTELADSEDKKAMLNFIIAPQEMGRPYVAPPEVPQDRLEALRAAFTATMEDPEFLAAAEAAGLSITPSTGEELQAIVESVYATDPAVIQQVIEATK